MLLVILKKFLGRRQVAAAEKAETESIEDMIKQIQDGDLILRNQFITDYQPYVAKITSGFSKRYIDPSKDDEYSIALAAFNEAINQYSTESGNSFLGFAKTVMTRRLIDYVRKEERHTKQIPYSAFEVEDDEENLLNPIEISQAVDQYEENLKIETRKEEILELNSELKEFDITFSDLVDCSPKHVDSRETLIEIGKKLAEQTELFSKLKDKKMLPIKDLLDIVEVSRKTLERNRKFIIAVCLVQSGPYPYLKEYLHKERKD
ncbi:RNA polymerase sigma factor SigI [Marinicrinis lubricantis]|uniref:RNA polymerase sigma factor SigI n=1 Tax=Marinicrinis lubricantis TaxID=2086470 RepID=A0ABW1IQE3_9BACL